jgi:predicted RNA-binding Zn-ribbon protein involved in translation (DUF1610 family)/DNA-directed RNA polymerase subunit RPC12/RpoP
MSDYFCPNCGADIGEQYGFDPDKGVWTCTNCGETLYGDDIEETMDQFDGVVWRCDSCGALLNKQSGFYDSCETWYCTECGHANRISEDEIYESEEDYQKSKKEYKCPYCGSTLNDQYSFDEEAETHTCTWCDIVLCKDGDEYKVQYRCPNCDAILNDQWTFYEGSSYHTCSECGKELYLSDNKYIIESDDDEDNDDGDDENDQSEENQDDTDDSAYQRQEELRGYAEEQQRQEKARVKREKKKAFRRKHWKAILLTVFVLGAALFGGYKYWEYSKLIPVGVSAESLQNTDYESVVKILEDAGFTNVHTSSLYDLDYASKDDDGLVATVLILDNKSFEPDDKYPYDSRIDVKYHSVARASAPVSAKEAKGEQYSEVVDKLKDAGFGDIAISVDYDLITGWINGAGEVESISINGDSSFDSGSMFTVDSKIEIVYHDFKKNNPNK